MHELSIAMSIVECVEEECLRHGVQFVSAVHLRLGSLTGIATKALMSSYRIACMGTHFSRSRLIIEELPGLVYCPACDVAHPVKSSEWFLCSECGGQASNIVQGKEIELTGMEVHDQLPAQPPLYPN